MNPNPPYLHPPYKSSLLRGPKIPLVKIESSYQQINGPQLDSAKIRGIDSDLTRNNTHSGQPQGEKIIVTGRLSEASGKPIANSVVEIWQANAAGRYCHGNDQHDAPLDQNFSGAGRCVTDKQGNYTFTTIKPGAYPWANHNNAWRPAHIHFSVFGRAFSDRLITQMYFPGDPLLAFDPIFNAIADNNIRTRLVSRFSLDHTVADTALGYEFNIVVQGSRATPMEGG